MKIKRVIETTAGRSVVRIPLKLTLKDADELHERLGCYDDIELAQVIAEQLSGKLRSYRLHLKGRS